MNTVRSRLLVLAAVAFAVLALESPRAQSAPPRPNVAITKMPTLMLNTWPADVDRDGDTDLVAGRILNPETGGPVDLVVTPGNGDGTFGADRIVGDRPLAPITVGDFNGDSRVDIVAIGVELYILAGRGDGTFAPPVPVPGQPHFRADRLNGMTADFNGDGHRDLAISGLNEDAVHIFHGNGDLTFDAPASLATNAMSRQFIVRDLNGDARPDIAVATQNSGTVDVFLNDGAGGFAYSVIDLERAALGITAADMNGDGAQDLIVSTGTSYFGSDTVFLDGFVNVLAGRGDGTFAAPMAFPTNDGPALAVVGDYNGDGLTDVATGNLSGGRTPSCDTLGDQWDSISILPGLGGGRLGPAASFALDNAVNSRYRDAMVALKTSDFNGDGRTDLIATRGAIVLSTAPATNRPPAVDAGPDRSGVRNDPSGNVLQGSAADPDSDWLTWEWTDRTGKVLGTQPKVCFRDSYTGRQTFTLTVQDLRGGVGTDTVVYDFAGDLPAGWGGQDVGAVGASGSSSYDGVRYTVRGSGADIWGTADEFHFVDTLISGDFEFTAYVPYVQNVDRWTKAGLMIRDGLSADARHASLFATPRTERGVAFQRRPTAGGTSVHTSGPAVAPPVWLRLTRRGDLVTAATSANGTTWTAVGEQRLSGLPPSVQVGLAVSSHVDGTLAEAWFEQVALVSLDSHVPEGWLATDVGDVGARGRTSVDEDSGPEFAVYGSGADVWGAADEFHFASHAITGDFVFAARVAHVENIDRWTKAGLMMRDGLAANARHAFLIQTPGTERGVAFQRRPVTGGATVHTAGAANAPPAFLLLVREGDVISAFYKTEPEGLYTLVGRQTFAGLPATVRVGFAVSSHVDGALATALFDNVAIVQPSAWESSDVGDVSAEGSSYIDGPSGFHGVTGSGADVWGAADEFHFMSREVTGDFTFIAEARQVENVHPWTKAGLMLRDGLAANARHAFAFDTGSTQHGLAFQRRPTAGGATLHTAGPTDWTHEEVWLRLVRQGDVVSAYYKGHSTSAWTLLGTQTFAGLPATVRLGFAVTSHADGTLATAVFDNVMLIQ